MSLNAAGTRLAVGAPFDDSAGNRNRTALDLLGPLEADVGAVYLFTFTDTAFSGGRLAAVVGDGYAGGRNIDVTALEDFDRFGTSVSLNAAGTRLAVGAPSDDGAGNQTPDIGGLYWGVGAVYLFTFTDTAFSGGRLAAVVGNGYAGGRNIDVTALQVNDQFGFSVSLNAAGTRLAVGAVYDAGVGNTTARAGAAYLFTFTNASFSGGRLVATVGKGYRGGRNVDVPVLERFDELGTSVSLNAAGTRLAVGAPGIDVAGDRTLRPRGGLPVHVHQCILLGRALGRHRGPRLHGRTERPRLRTAERPRGRPLGVAERGGYPSRGRGRGGGCYCLVSPTDPSRADGWSPPWARASNAV